MKKFVRKFTWTTGLFLLTFLANAQADKKWTLSDCIQYAVQHNIQINTLRLTQQKTEQDVWAAKGAQIPSLTGSVGNSLNNGFFSAGNGTGITDQLINNGTYSLNSSVTLWNAGYVRNNIRQQELLSKSAGLSVQQAQNNLTLQITQDYLSVLLTQENIQYISSLLATSDSLVKQGQVLYDAGSIAKVALLQLQSQLASDQYLLVQSKNTLRQNILTLKQLLQLPTDSSFDVAMFPTIEMKRILPSLSAVQESAWANFPDSRIGQLGLEVANLDIEKARAAAQPSLKAYGNIGSGYSSVLMNSIDPKTGILTQNRNNLYENIGLTLSIPIFSQRLNKTNLEKARLGKQQAGLDLQNTQLILSQSVEQAYLNVQNAIQSFDAAQVQLQTATENYRIGNEQFRLGAITAYDLQVLRNTYVQAIQSFTQAKYNAVLQQKIYEFYNGTPITL